MANIDDSLAHHVLYWIYSNGFDEVTNSHEILEAILNGLALLESAGESDGTCNNNGKVMTVSLVGNLTHFCCNYMHVHHIQHKKRHT